VPNDHPTPFVHLPAPRFTTSPGAPSAHLSPVAETAETVMALGPSPPADEPMPLSPAPLILDTASPAPPETTPDVPAPVPTSPAPLTQEPVTNPSAPPSIRAPSLDSDAGIAMAESLNCLQELFPAASEPLAVRALELHSWDVASASAFLAAVFRTDATLGALATAFPGAKPPALVEALRANNGDPVATFTHLSTIHDSPWGSIGRASTATRLAASAMLQEDEPTTEEFTDRDPAFSNFESNWWTSYSNTFRLRLGDQSPSLLLWEPVAAISVVRRDIAPRFRSYITDLALRGVDENAYKKALRTLCALPGYRRLADLVTNLDQWEAAVAIIKCLLEEGLCTPGAAGWLAYQYANSPPPEGLDSSFNLFTLKFKKVWDLRNRALHSWKKHRGSLSPSKIPIIDLTDSAGGSPSPPSPASQRAASISAAESRLHGLESGTSRPKRMTASGKSLAQRSLEEAAWGSIRRPQDQEYYSRKAAKLAAKEASLKKSRAHDAKKSRLKGKGNTD
jgi:hypothetical protein